MAHYIVLANYTEQGIKNVKDTVKRADAFKELAKKHGVTVHSLYWTLGRIDMVTHLEAKSDTDMTALGLTIGMLGNIRTETLPAFDAAAMAGILGKVG